MNETQRELNESWEDFKSCRNLDKQGLQKHYETLWGFANTGYYPDEFSDEYEFQIFLDGIQTAIDVLAN